MWYVQETNALNAVSTFKRVDEDWCAGASGGDESGTTATLCMLQAGGMLTVANVGDSKAILVKKEGTCARS